MTEPTEAEKPMVLDDTQLHSPPIQTTRRFSASRLKTYSECPLRGHFKYDQLLPEPENAKATFGSVVHEALYLFNTTGDIDRAREHFKDAWKNPKREPDWWPRGATYGGLRDTGLEMLDRYAESLQWDTREVLACEHPFLVPFGKFELTGFVDLLELRRSGNGRRMLLVTDYKTGWTPNNAALKLDLQFTVYMYVVGQPEFWEGNGTSDFPPVPGGLARFEELAEVPRRAIWFQLPTQKSIDCGPRSDEDYTRMYRLCLEIEKAEQAQVFVPRIGDACQLCSFTKECGIDIQRADDDASWI